MFDAINLRDELDKLRSNDESLGYDTQEIKDFAFENQISIADFNLNGKLLFQSKFEIIQQLKKSNKGIPALLRFYNHDDAYDLKAIQILCEKYRLRFLDSKYFKGDLPEEAIDKIKALQRENNVNLTDYFLLAPMAMFDLDDAQKDPLLFVPLENGKYLLVHQWGKDLVWYRKIMAFPLKNIYTFLSSLMVLAVILSLITPTSWIEFEMRSWTLRVWLATHIFIALTGFLIFVGGIYQRNFSSAEWNSQYFNG